MYMKKYILLILFLFICTFGLVKVEAKSYDLYEQIKSKAVLDNQASDFVSSSTGINFLEIASDTNGKGVYIISDTKDDEYPIYYYRGNIDNNHIAYAGFCWQMVRTTEKGGIKLLYTGKLSENGTCDATGNDLMVDKVSYGLSNGEIYLGYMYALDGEEPNSNSSIIKEATDNWFKENMLDYINDLEDSLFCNDRSKTNDDFNTVLRLKEGKPTLSCANLDDSFSVNEDIGNGKLTYPVGIINSDEVTYGGGLLKGTSLETYLFVGASYWAMSPYSVTKILYPNSKGMLNMNTIEYSTGVRPMIVLKNGAIYHGGDGTKESPYNIVDKPFYDILTDDDSVADKVDAQAGESITITVNEKDGYNIKGLLFYDSSDKEISINYETNVAGVYLFEMPNEEVRIKAVYEEIVLEKDENKEEVKNPETGNFVTLYIIMAVISFTFLYYLVKKFKNV